MNLELKRFVVFSCSMLTLAGAVRAADPMFEAIMTDDGAKVAEIAAANPQLVNTKLYLRSYPIIEAAKKIKLDALRALIESGAKVNTKNAAGDNAAFLILRDGKIYQDKEYEQLKGLLDLMAEKGLQTNSVNKAGENLMYVIAPRLAGKTSLDRKLGLMQWLLDHKMTMRDTGRAESPLVMTALQRMSSKDYAKKCILETVRFLIENGADPNAADAKGDTPLIKIIKTKTLTEPEKVELVSLLVENGAKPRKKNKKKVSPISLVEKKSPLYKALKTPRR